MAYSDKAGKTILNAYAKVKAPIYATVVPGDLLTYDSGNYGFKLADQSDNLAASMVACESGVSGDTIDIAAAVEFETPATIGTGGAVSDNNLAAAADVGKPLYIGESGKVSDSVGGTCTQIVGRIMSRTRALLMPMASLSGTALTLSGNLAVGGTLAVTGASTLTGAVALNGGATVATGKDFTMVKGTLTNTEGDLVLTKGDATLTEGNLTLTAGNLAMTKGNITLTEGHLVDYVTSISDDTAATIAGTYIVDTTTKDVTLTLPAAAAGLTVTAIATSATKQLTVAAASGDKILEAYVAKDKMKANAAAGAMITLRCLTTTNWIALDAGVGTWVYS